MPKCQMSEMRARGRNILRPALSQPEHSALPVSRNSVYTRKQQDSSLEFPALRKRLNSENGVIIFGKGVISEKRLWP